MKNSYVINYQNSIVLDDVNDEQQNTRVKRIVDLTGRKRRIYSNIHNDPKQSGRRFRANDRERRRMNSLNGALHALKGCVPFYHGKKRLTKLQILQFACHYINDLSELLCSPTPNIEQQQNDRYNNSIDFIMTYMNDQQHTTEHQQEHFVPTNYNVNGLNMTQRIEYLNQDRDDINSVCHQDQTYPTATLYPGLTNGFVPNTMLRYF